MSHATAPRDVIVESSGPVDADVLWVGEAPGRDELLHRPPMPFVGASGQMVRRALTELGYGDERVRFANVVGVNPGRLLPSMYDRLLDEWWESIDVELAVPRRVIVACGGLALRRLTGLTSISDEHGGVVPASDVPPLLTVRGRARETKLPEGAVVVPVLHPAGIMRTVLQADRLPWRRAVERIVWLSGHARHEPYVWPRVVVNPDRDAFAEQLERSTAVTIDTEFDMRTGVPFMIGVQMNQLPIVYILRGDLGWYTQALANAFVRDDVTWISHNNPAEFRSLATLGIDATRARWYDTMLAFATLYPDVEVGLNHAALYYIDGIRNWKHLPHDSIEYLRNDVWTQRVVYERTRDELTSANMMSLFVDEVMPSVVPAYDMERRGIRVDDSARVVLLERNTARRDEIGESISVFVAEHFAARVAVVEGAVDALVEQVSTAYLACPSFAPCIVKKHDEYMPWRAKKWMTDERCTCHATYERADIVAWRAGLATMKDAKSKVRVKARGLASRGFRPANNHDLRWLVYDALRLPTQHNAEGKATIDKTAAQRLVTRVLEARDGGNRKSKYWRDDVDQLVAVLVAIRDYRHLEKVASTFLSPPVDGDGVAHPPYRTWGAGTGRPASGADDDADDTSSEYAFNVLNVPHDCRRIFVPSRAGWSFVAADWSQLESWLTAALADDQVMLGELRAQLTGGFKVHSLNAALLYGIDPADAKSFVVTLQGQRVPAYDAGKRLSHMWNYGARPSMLASTFWIERRFATRAVELLDAKYAATAAWRARLTNEVFGVARFVCPCCRLSSTEPASCSACSRPKSPVMRRQRGWYTAPTCVHYTPFRRRRWYLGRRGEGANALASQDPQSCGASMAYRTLHRLYGFEVVDGERRAWPTPSVEYRVVTFTYDSFVVECRDEDVDEVASWLLWTMERPWPIVTTKDDGAPLRVPSELSVGRNWGDATSDNVDGLAPRATTPLATTWHATIEAAS